MSKDFTNSIHESLIGEVKKPDSKQKKNLEELLGDGREIRTKRISLVVTPSIHKAIKRVSLENDITINELLNRMITRELELIGALEP